MSAGTEAIPARSRSRRRRYDKHGLSKLRRSVTNLTTRRLDGRSALAVAVRRWKEDVRRDLGGDLTRAQESVLELAAQAWVIVSSLDDWIARQPSLVNARKKTLLPVVAQRMQIAEGLARHLERLGLERQAKPVETLENYLARKAEEEDADAVDGEAGNQPR